MMESPDKEGWAGTQCLRISEVRRELPVRVIIEVSSLDLAPSSAYANVASSRVERAIFAALSQIKQAMQSTSQLGFLREDAKEILTVDQSANYLKGSIIHGMPAQLFQVLNKDQYTIAGLINVT